VATPDLTAFRQVVALIPAAAAKALAPLPDAVGRQIAAVLVDDARRRFATSTDPGGRAWKPLKHKRPNGGDKPLLDTGLLRASVQAKPTATGAVVYSNLPQAFLHEYGGTVKPTRGKYIAIPLTREAKRAGSPRRFKGELKFRPIRGRVAKGVLYQPAKRKGGKPVDQYLLVTQTVVPARPFLAPSATALRAIADIAAAAVDRAMPTGGN
jgi:phage gpG-like protein